MKTKKQYKPGKSDERAMFADIEREIGKLSIQELKELLMINTYKLAVARSQIEAMTQILIKERITTYEEIWKKTQENLKDAK